MKRNINLVIPALVAGILAGCSGGNTTSGPQGTAAPALAATTGSATSWTAVKWGGGGYVTGLVYHPANSSLLYARTDVGGAYRWNATNSTWTPITDGIGWGGGEGKYHGVESLAVDPNNDQLVYIMTGDSVGSDKPSRIYISSNRGTTWTHYDLPFAVGGNNDARAYGERLQVDPQNPTILMYGSRQAGIWKSTDSGHTWNQVTSFSTTTASGAMIGVEQIVFDTSLLHNQNPSATQIIWATVNSDYAQAAGLTSTLYKSTNGGLNWAPVAVPSTVTGYDIPHVVRAADGNFYMTFRAHAGQAQGATGPSYLYKYGASNGNTWTPLRSSTSVGYAGLSVSGTGSTARIALGVTGWNDASQLVLMSDDGGLNWHDIEAGMPHTGITVDDCKGWVEGVTIDPANRDHIMHIFGGGVCETMNASSATPTWSAKVNNLEETATLSLVAAPAGASYKFINSVGDVGTWLNTSLTTRPTKGPLNAFSNGNAADMSWADPTYIAISGVDNRPWPHVPFAYWSGDAGTTWTKFASLPTGAAANESHVQSIAVPSRNNVIWAPPDSVPSYSTNSGASWTATNLPAFGAIWNGWPQAYRLAADRVNPNKVYAYDSGGATWGQPGKVYISYDGGHNFGLSGMWGAQNMAPNSWNDTSMVVNPNAEGDIWVADGKALYHSTNSGWNWVQVGTFAPANGTMGATKVALGKAQAGSTYSAAIYVQGTLNGQWGIFHSDDGGATWTRWNDDMHQFGDSSVMAGDWSTYGRLYVNGAGRGLQYSN